MSADFDAGEALARMEQLRAEIRERSDEIMRLQDILDGPRVTVLAHYVQYGHHGTEECDTIEDARTYLQGGSEYGYCAPEGISVNGEMRGWD